MKKRDFVAMKNEINFVLEMREARVNKLQSIVKKKKLLLSIRI